MVRCKHRYIIAECNETNKSDDKPLKLNSSSVYLALIRQIQQLHGDFGVAAVKTGLNVKYCNEHTRLVIIRARHGPHKFVASCLPILNTIEKKRVIVNTLYVGATLRQTFKFVLRYQQEKCDRFASDSLKTESEKELLFTLLRDSGETMEA